MDVFDHRKMVAGGAQVLPQRQDRDAVLSKSSMERKSSSSVSPRPSMMPLLVDTLPSTHSRAIRRTRRDRPVLGAEADNGREAFHRLQIVSENMRDGAAISVWMEEGFSFKSEASTSMIVEGLAF